MRIAFFVWEYPPTIVGGLGTYAQNMAPKFVKLGHDVVVFTLNRGGLPVREVMNGVEVHRPPTINASKVFPLLLAESVKRSSAGTRFFSDIFFFNILSAAKLLNDLIGKEGRTFDIVSFHDWLSSISGLMMKENSRIPCVFHVHSTEWGRTSGQVSGIVGQIEDEAAKAADRIITVSNVMRDDLLNHGWPSDKVEVVWNGVDAEYYNPERYKGRASLAIRQRYGIKEDEYMILFLGRLSRIKGVGNLVQAMPEVTNEFPKSKLVILGQGEAEQEVINTTKSIHSPDLVKLRFEFVTEEERILHYSASDVCVFPSTYEPFGIVSLEAMAMAKPLVVGASGVVGFKEQVVSNGPDRCGVHVNGADPKDIAWGIKEVLREPDQAKIWGLNGRRRAINLFTWDRAATETLKIYRKLI